MGSSDRALCMLATAVAISVHAFKCCSRECLHCSLLETPSLTVNGDRGDLVLCRKGFSLEKKLKSR